MSHKTIVISKKTRNDIVNWPFIKEKIIVIYNGIKPYEILKKEEAREYFEKNLNIKNEGILIGTISELHSNKGIDMMLSAIKDLDPNLNFKYIVIGAGEKESLLKK
jgi:glycosyltransferase involved in cell wall biosynthesis